MSNAMNDLILAEPLDYAISVCLELGERFYADKHLNLNEGACLNSK